MNTPPRKTKGISDNYNPAAYGDMKEARRRTKPLNKNLMNTRVLLSNKNANRAKAWREEQAVANIMVHNLAGVPRAPEVRKGIFETGQPVTYAAPGEPFPPVGWKKPNWRSRKGGKTKGRKRSRRNRKTRRARKSL